MAGHQQNAAISQLIDAFLAGPSQTSADIEAFCSAYPAMPELHQEIANAVKVRQARMRARIPVTQQASSGSSDTEGLPDRPRSFGRYALRSRIGGGGFGEVYHATRNDSQRAFAVKILRDEHIGQPEVMRRFRKEAQIVARLRHPGIVPVHEIGEVNGRPFIAMKHVRGVDLHRFTRAEPIDPNLAARIVANAADACHSANEAGVIHRDIKPENILVEEGGRVLVVDFGLAKQLDAGTKLTKSLQRLGTPHYMPPEQADPRLGPISPSCDVYGLGATLYFLLTGRPPFPVTAGVGSDATLHQIAWDRPVFPAKLNPAVPQALERVCLQCLEKSPLDRYATVAHLATDLRRFVAGEQVAARMPGRILRVRRWCARRPVATTVLAIAALAMFGGSAASIHFATRAQSAEIREKTATSDRIRREYIADMRDAQTALNRGETPVAIALLDKYVHIGTDDDPRGFEWYYLRRVAASPSPSNITRKGTIWNRIALSAEGDKIACTDQEGRLTIFRVEDGTQLSKHDDHRITDFAFFPEGSRAIALTDNNRLIIIDAATGAVTRQSPTGFITSCLALSPDGSTCFIGSPGNDLQIWSIPSFDSTDLARNHKRGMFNRSLDVQNGSVTAATFHPRDSKIAIGFENGVTQVWDIPSAEITTRGPVHTGPVTGISFDNEGSRLVSQSYGVYNMPTGRWLNGQVFVWNPTNGKTDCTIEPHHQIVMHESVDSNLSYLQLGFLRSYFSADENEIITTGPFAVQRWEIPRGHLTGQFVGSGSRVHALTMSQNGMFIAAVDATGNPRVWPIDDSGSARTVFCEKGGIRAMHGNGNRLAILYELGVDEIIGVHGPSYGRSDWREIALFDTRSGETERLLKQHSQTDELNLLPNGFAFGTSPFRLAPNADSLDWEKILRSIPKHSALAVNPNGELIAIGYENGDLEIWDATRIAKAHSLPHHQGEMTSLAFSTDGRWLATGGMDRRINVFDCQQWESIATLQGHRREIGGLAFSPNGLRLASGSGLLRIESTQPGEVRLWDFAVGQLCLELSAGSTDIYPGVAWSGDGEHLFAAANALPAAQSTIEPGRVVVWEIGESRTPASPPEPQDESNPE